MFVPAVPMEAGSYSDTGYRFRYNIFERQDGYFIPIFIDNIFFDYFEFSTDTYKTSPKGKE